MEAVEIEEPKPIYQDGPMLVYKNHEDLEKARLIKDLNMTDMEKFEQFMSLMRLGYKLKNVPKVHKQMGL